VQFPAFARERLDPGFKPNHHQELATAAAAAAAVGGWVGSWGEKRDGGNQRFGVIMLHRDTGTRSPESRARSPEEKRYSAAPAAAVLWLRLKC